MLVLVARIMYLRKLEKITAEDACEALLVLESYMIRRVLLLVPVSSLNKICAYVASSLEGDAGKEVHRMLSTGRRHYQKDSTVFEAVQSEQKVYGPGRQKQLHAILSWLLEGSQGKDSIDFTSMTIEHVLPQTLEGSARAEFAATLAEGQEVSATHEDLLHTLGNLTLTNYNTELSNKPFSMKRAEGLSKTGVLANQAIAANSQWGPEQIVARSEALAWEILKTWKGPDEALLEVEPISKGRSSMM